MDGPEQGSLRMRRRRLLSVAAAWRCATVAGLLTAFSARPTCVAEEPTANEPTANEPAAILARRCLECHNSAELKGGLDLSRRESALTGGDSGASIDPTNVEGSLLWQRVAADEMPPEHPLEESEKQALRGWLTEGAPYPSEPIDPFRFSSSLRAGYDWWSLQPIVRPPLPEVTATDRVGNSVDAFVLARLEEQGLPLSAPADRRRSIRRLSFDLLGLPPTPAEVEAFANDAAPDAYERLVDRLLASPHYGERWARHWLDVVRFGESQGFERDKLRPNAWTYRDWLIWAFNSDLPYDEFVRLQLAGDVLQPDDPSAVAATGFLVAGPYDEVGQTQQSAAMRAVVRQDELEDLIGVTCQTFLGLTANCARCHDHKFDPISQRDYYQLAAALGGVRHGERERATALVSDTVAARRAALNAEIADIEPRLAELRLLASSRMTRSDAASAVALPAPVLRWEFNDSLADSAAKLEAQAFGAAALAEGRLVLDGQTAYVATAPLPFDLREKTLSARATLSTLDQGGGAVISVQTLDGAVFDAIVYGEREPQKWLPGSDGFRRTQDLPAPPEESAAQESVLLTLVFAADGQIRLYRNGQPYGEPYASSGPQPFAAGQAQVVFGLRHSPVGERKLLAGAIERAELYSVALTPEQVAALAGAVLPPTEDELRAALTPAERFAWDALELERSRLALERGLLSGGPAYAVSPRPPEPTFRLVRGNPGQPAEEVAPGSVAAVRSGTPLELPADSPDAPRRAALASWLTDELNPLVARVIVNRLWHYHFGAGLVDTPNDFGFNGGRPTHPELLDFLASELQASGWRLKHVQRLIVTSATYRQDSRSNDAGLARDAQNRWLWRKSPLRLEAETLRDAVLAIAGQLNPALGGPGYADFRTFTFNSQFYEPIDVDSYATRRRSIYRMWVRSGTNRLLDVLDCPDPSTATPRRASTTTPTQALALLNDALLLRMAQRTAERVEREAGTAPAAQIQLLFALCYARPAAPDEVQLAMEFSAQFGLPALVRVLFNSNEFVYVE